MSDIKIISDVKTTKKLVHRNRISFHKHCHMTLNRTVLNHTNIKANQYIELVNVDLSKRYISMIISNNKPRHINYKIITWRNEHYPNCFDICAQMTQLKKLYNITLYGAFKYTITNLINNDKLLIIYF